MDLNRRSDILLLGFVTLSLLLHLLFLYLLPEHALVPAPSEKRPVYVDLRPPQPLSRELDLPRRPELEKPRETPAKRLGATDQVVEQETAPKGEDFEDLTPKAAPPPSPPVPVVEPSKPAPKPVPKAEPAATPRPATDAEPRRRPGSSGPPPLVEPVPAMPETTPPTERTPPSAERLKSLDLMASAKSAAVTITDQWRRKHRAEVEEGDTVWLDMEKDILISFFQRFRNNVYMVWNYPDIARELGQAGTCLLRVSITRNGEVKGVELKETSGHPLLDHEAMQAIRKGAPYGPLPKAYPKDELNIMVFFQYEISRSRPLLY
jgi:protein TonB